MTADQNANADLLLRDILSKDIEGMTPDELLVEAADDFGDRRALAREFDRALVRAVARERKRQILERLSGFAKTLAAPSWRPMAATVAALIVVVIGGVFYLKREPAVDHIAEEQAKRNAIPYHTALLRDSELDALLARIEELRSAGDSTTAVASADRYLVVAKNRYGEEHPAYAIGLNELAELYQSQGRYSEAEPLLKRSIAINERTLGANRPELAMLLNNLAELYRAQGRHREAEPIYARSLAVAERALGREHPQAAAVRNSLRDLQAQLAPPGGTPTDKVAQDSTAQRWPLRSVLSGHAESVDACAFSPDGLTLLTASRSALRLWNVPSGYLTDNLSLGDVRLTSVAFGPDGRQVVALTSDRIMMTWKPGAKLLLEPLRSSRSGIIGQALVQGEWRAVARLDSNTAEVFGPDDKVAILRGHEAPVSEATFSSDGKLVLTTSDDKTARVWNAETGRQISVLSDREAGMASAAFSSDGRSVVTFNRQQADASLWDVASGTRIAVLDGHSAPVLDAAFSPDGRQLITTSEDATARVWNAATGQLVTILRGHGGPVTSAVFSPDGQLLATTSQDRTARLWSVLSPANR